MFINRLKALGLVVVFLNLFFVLDSKTSFAGCLQANSYSCSADGDYCSIGYAGSVGMWWASKTHYGTCADASGCATKADARAAVGSCATGEGGLCPQGGRCGPRVDWNSSSGKYDYHSYRGNGTDYWGERPVRIVTPPDRDCGSDCSNRSNMSAGEQPQWECTKDWRTGFKCGVLYYDLCERQNKESCEATNDGLWTGDRPCKWYSTDVCGPQRLGNMDFYPWASSTCHSYSYGTCGQGFCNNYCGGYTADPNPYPAGCNLACPSKNLTVVKAGSGTGTVTSSPSGINCGTSCPSVLAAFPSGASVVLHSVKSDGSNFTGWSGGGCTGTGDCTVVMSADQTVTATFTLIPTCVAAPPTGLNAGSITVSSATVNWLPGNSGQAGYSQKIRVGAVRAEVENGCPAGSSCVVATDLANDISSYPLSGLSSNTEYYYRIVSYKSESCNRDAMSLFKTSPPESSTFMLTVNKVGTGTGTVTSSPDDSIDCGSVCLGYYEQGTSTRLSALATSGSIFTGWSGEGCSGTGKCDVFMTQERNVTATFTLNAGPTGTISGNVYLDGTATAKDPKVVNLLRYQGGSCQSSNCWVSVDSKTTSAWSFTYNVGDEYRVTVTAPDGYVNGPSLAVAGSGCPTKDTPTTGNLSWYANKLLPAGGCSGNKFYVSQSAVTSYDLTVIKAGTGTGTVTSTSSPTQPGQISCDPTCTVSYNSGTSVTLSAAAASGSTFTGWSGDMNGSVNPKSLTMNTAKNVTATFTLNAGPTGTISGNVFEDTTNGDGVKDPGEPNSDQAVLKFAGYNGSSGSIPLPASGAFSIPLAPDDYRVLVDPVGSFARTKWSYGDNVGRAYKSGGTYTYDATKSGPNDDFPLSVTVGHTTSVNLGIKPIPSGNVTINIYNDLNGNGIFESPPETRVSGATFHVGCSSSGGSCPADNTTTNGIISLTLPSDKDYSFIYNPASPNPPAYTRVTGGNVGGVTSACAGSTSMICNIANLGTGGVAVNFLIAVNPPAWIQTWDGDVHGNCDSGHCNPGAAIQITVPSGSYFVHDSLGGNGGGVVSTLKDTGGAVCPSTSVNCSEKSWLVSQPTALPWPPVVDNYLVSGCNGNVCYLPSSQTIDDGSSGINVTDFRGSGRYSGRVVIVGGDLIIKGDRVATAGTAINAIIVVKGKIAIDGSSSNSLEIKGGLLARDNFDISYSLTNNVNPAVVFKFNPNILLLTTGLSQPTYTWREVTQ